MLGTTFDEKFTTTDYQRPTRTSSAFEGGLTGTFHWAFEPLGARTKATVDITYRVARGAIGRAVDSLVLERTNEKSIEGMLENLRRGAVEAGAPSKT